MSLIYIFQIKKKAKNLLICLTTLNKKALENVILEIFANKNDLFDHDDINNEDRKFIINLIGRTNFNFDGKFIIVLMLQKWKLLKIK